MSILPPPESLLLQNFSRNNLTVLCLEGNPSKHWNLEAGIKSQIFNNFIRLLLFRTSLQPPNNLGTEQMLPCSERSFPLKNDIALPPLSRQSIHHPEPWPEISLQRTVVLPPDGNVSGSPKTQPPCFPSHQTNPQSCSPSYQGFSPTSPSVEPKGHPLPGWLDPSHRFKASCPSISPAPPTPSCTPLLLGQSPLSTDPHHSLLYSSYKV